jgi:3-deoxy-D-arabino-heptulosonate 7-phosphate (DAHP) synthase
MSTSIIELPTHLRVELGPGDATEMMSTYQEAAVRCLAKGLTRALIVARNGESQVHQELSSTLRAMAQAGCAAGFRVALVAENPRTAAIYEAAAAMARELGLDVSAFVTEESALAWLAS